MANARLPTRSAEDKLATNALMKTSAPDDMADEGMTKSDLRLLELEEAMANAVGEDKAHCEIMEVVKCIHELGHDALPTFGDPVRRGDFDSADPAVIAKSSYDMVLAMVGVIAKARAESFLIDEIQIKCISIMEVIHQCCDGSTSIRWTQLLAGA